MKSEAEGKEKGVVKPDHGTKYKQEFDSLIRDVRSRKNESER